MLLGVLLCDVLGDHGPGQDRWKNTLPPSRRSRYWVIFYAVLVQRAFGASEASGSLVRPILTADLAVLHLVDAQRLAIGHDSLWWWY